MATASFSTTVATTTRPHFRTASKSHPIGLDPDSSTYTGPAASSSSSSSHRAAYTVDHREHSAFRSWQFPASPDPNDHVGTGGNIGLDSIIEDDDTSMSSEGSESPIVRKGKGRPVFQSRTSAGNTSSHHHTTPSLPYTSFHQSHPSADCPTAYRSSHPSSSAAGRSRVLSNGVPPSLTRSSSFAGQVTFGPFDIFPFLFTNLRRAKYNDLCFGFVFLTSLLAFFSALIGLGHDSSLSLSTVPGAFASPLPPGGLGGMRRVAMEEQRAAADAKRRSQQELLRLIKPIPVPNPKLDEPLFADVLPDRRQKQIDAEAAAQVFAPVEAIPPAAAVLDGEPAPAAVAQEAVLPMPEAQRGEVVGEPHQMMDEAQHALEHPDHVDEEATGAGIFDASEGEHGNHHHVEGEAGHGDVDVDAERIVEAAMGAQAQERPIPIEGRSDDALESEYAPTSEPPMDVVEPVMTDPSPIEVDASASADPDDDYEEDSTNAVEPGPVVAFDDPIEPGTDTDLDTDDLDLDTTDIMKRSQTPSSPDDDDDDDDDQDPQRMVLRRRFKRSFETVEEPDDLDFVDSKAVEPGTFDEGEEDAEEVEEGEEPSPESTELFESPPTTEEDVPPTESTPEGEPFAMEGDDVAPEDEEEAVNEEGRKRARSMLFGKRRLDQVFGRKSQR